MSEKPKTLLITGPTGSGKTALAQHVAESLGWAFLSEDDYWAKNGWGLGLRSEEQESIIQQQVLSDLLAATTYGRNVALEFILYKHPPNALTAYQEALSKNEVQQGVVVLKPPIDVLLKRIEERGRPNDNDYEQVRHIAENQLAILDADFIDKRWVINPEDMTLEALINLSLTRTGLQE